MKTTLYIFNVHVEIGEDPRALQRTVLIGPDSFRGALPGQSHSQDVKSSSPPRVLNCIVYPINICPFKRCAFSC